MLFALIFGRQLSVSPSLPSTMAFQTALEESPTKSLANNRSILGSRAVVDRSGRASDSRTPGATARPLRFEFELFTSSCEIEPRNPAG